MTWSISASGSKAECMSQLETSKANGDPANARQYERMRTFLIQELSRYEDGSSSISISASGHVPGGDGGHRSLSISFSGTAAPRPEPTKLARRDDLPAVTGTLNVDLPNETVKTR